MVKVLLALLLSTSLLSSSYSNGMEEQQDLGGFQKKRSATLIGLEEADLISLREAKPQGIEEIRSGNNSQIISQVTQASRNSEETSYLDFLTGEDKQKLLTVAELIDQRKEAIEAPKFLNVLKKLINASPQDRGEKNLSSMIRLVSKILNFDELSPAKKLMLNSLFNVLQYSTKEDDDVVQYLGNDLNALEVANYGIEEFEKLTGAYRSLNTNKTYRRETREQFEFESIFDFTPRLFKELKKIFDNQKDGLTQAQASFLKQVILGIGNLVTYFKATGIDRGPGLTEPGYYLGRICGDKNFIIGEIEKIKDIYDNCRQYNLETEAIGLGLAKVQFNLLKSTRVFEEWFVKLTPANRATLAIIFSLDEDGSINANMGNIRNRYPSAPSLNSHQENNEFLLTLMQSAPNLSPQDRAKLIRGFVDSFWRDYLKSRDEKKSRSPHEITQENALKILTLCANFLQKDPTMSVDEFIPWLVKGPAKVGALLDLATLFDSPEQIKIFFGKLPKLLEVKSDILLKALTN